MISLRQTFAATIVAGALALTHSAQASVIGVAVGAIGSVVEVGNTVVRPMSPIPAIKYFIPLGNGDGTYGVGGFGTTQDYGNGGGTLTMILAFQGVSLSSPSKLEILFEDLDLDGANDPWYFLESMQLFRADNTQLTNLITDISDPLVAGDKDTQQLLSLSLGVLDADPFYLVAKFKSDSKYHGYNTPEYLIATVSAVPLPAAGWMMLTGLVGLAGVGLRRRSKRMDAAA